MNNLITEQKVYLECFFSRGKKYSSAFKGFCSKYGAYKITSETTLKSFSHVNNYMHSQMTADWFQYNPMRHPVSSCLVGGILGVIALPLIGFGFGGVTANSLAASWQASIGNVAAGGLFATLQSLGATKLGPILFGSFGAATPYLVGIAVRLNWCDEHRDH